MTNYKLIIGIKDGIPYIVQNNDNVEITFLNYDVEGIHEEDLEEDDLGNKCIIDTLQ